MRQERAVFVEACVRAFLSQVDRMVWDQGSRGEEHLRPFSLSHGVRWENRRTAGVVLRQKRGKKQTAALTIGKEGQFVARPPCRAEA